MNRYPKILIVDDEIDLVAVLRIALERRGYVVRSAYDLETGLEAAAEERPDCIVLDVMMPHATEGFHFVWRLRQRDQMYFKDVPIITMSAIHEKSVCVSIPTLLMGTYMAGSSSGSSSPFRISLINQSIRSYYAILSSALFGSSAPNVLPDHSLRRPSDGRQVFGI